MVTVRSSIQKAEAAQLTVQEKSLTAQYIKKNSEIRSRKRKAERGQVVRINKEEIHGKPWGINQKYSKGYC